MVAIMLVGALAFQFLPLSALPEVDYPTIQVQTFYPGASPDVMTSSVTAPLGAPARRDARPQADVVDELGRRLGHHPAVRPRSFARHRRAGGAGRDQRRRQPPAERPAGAADLCQGQSGGCADPDARAHLEDTAAAADRGPRRHAACAENLAAAGRGPRQHQRRPAPGRAHPGRYQEARRLRPQYRRSAHHHRQRQRRHAQGQFRRPDARLLRSTPTISFRTQASTWT